MRTENDALRSLARLVHEALPDVPIYRTLEGGEQPERPFAVVSADGEWEGSDFHAAPDITLPATVYVYVRGDTRKAALEAAERARETLWHAVAVGAAPNRERLVELYDFTGKPAVQRVTLAGATSGTWTLSLDGDETEPLPAVPQARTIRLALEDLAGVGAGNVVVFSRRLGGPWDVRFDREIRGQAVATLVADVTDLDGPDPAADVEVLTIGAPEPWRNPRDYMRVVQPTLGGLPDPTDPRLRTVTLGLRLTWGRLGHVRSGEMHLRTITARVRPQQP